jgi:hypothetical protein
MLQHDTAESADRWHMFSAMCLQTALVHFALLGPCGAVLLLHLALMFAVDGVCSAIELVACRRMQPFVPVMGMAGA